MIKDLTIHNYKNLQNLTLSGLQRFNLFLGNNNSGKSSLLEALLLFSSACDREVLRFVLVERGFLLPSVTSQEDNNKEIVSVFASLINGRSVSKFYKDEIAIASDSDSIRLKFVDVFEQYKKNELSSEDVRVRSWKVYGPEDDDNEMGERPALQVLVNGEHRDLFVFDNAVYRTNNPKHICASDLVLTSQLSNSLDADHFDKISMTNYERELIRALQIVEPRIVAINFLKNTFARKNYGQDRIPFVLLDNGQRYQLSSMGDGINRILTIILSLLNCENGIFLVDEFENGLHYSVQTKLWEVIKAISCSLNIQVFATTHSNDCIRSFIDSGASSDGSVFRLEVDQDKITPVQFSNQDRLKFAISQNIEIR